MTGHEDGAGLSAASGKFFGLAADLFCVAGEDGRIRSANARWAEVLGWSPEDLRDRPYIDLVHPEDRAATLEAVDTMQRGQALPRFRNRFLTRAGGWVNLEWSAVVDPDTGLIYAAGRDVGADMRAAERAQEVETLSGVGSWDLDLVTDTLKWSRQIFAIYDHDPAGQLDVDGALARFPEPDRSMLAGALERAATTGESFDLELNFVSMKGAAKLVRATGAAETQAGRIVRLFGAFQDISRQKRAERSLKNIIAGADAGTWEWNVQTGESSFNERWASMIGYELADLQPISNDTWIGLLHPDDFAEARKRLEAHFAGTTDHYRCEFRMRRPDGTWTWIHAHGQLLSRTADGAPEWMAGVHIDINDRKRAEAEMARSARLGRIIEDSLTEVFVFDAQTLRFVEVNRGARENLGYALPELLRMTPLDIKPDFTRAQFDTMIAPLREGRAPILSFRTRHKRRDGSTYPAEIRLQIMPETPPVFVAMVQDMTERNAAEAALIAAREEAEAASRAKSAFLATMSHEIRTPMNGVLGTASLLARTALDDEQKRMLRVIHDSGNVLLGVINDILDLSKVEAGKVSFESQPFTVDAVISPIRSVYSLKASEKGISLVTDIRTPAGLAWIGDVNRVSQVVHNVVSNAIKFTHRGEVVLHVSGDAAGPLRIAVRDTGIGMTAAQQALLFEPFAQADSSTTRKYGGSGLGMSIVKGLVQAMQGEIAVDSRPGKGTSVTITLPLPTTPLPEDPAQATAAATDPDRLDLTVLAADDNPINRMVLQGMLEVLGVRCTMVEDGQQALDAWRPGAFDMVLLDVSMPVVDGPTALAEIRRREHEAGAAPRPVLAITAHALKSQVAHYLGIGFSGHLAKPLSTEALRDTLWAAARSLPPSGGVAAPPPEGPPAPARPAHSDG